MILDLFYVLLKGKACDFDFHETIKTRKKFY
jgi:hypothetical protein